MNDEVPTSTYIRTMQIRLSGATCILLNGPFNVPDGQNNTDVCFHVLDPASDHSEQQTAKRTRSALTHIIPKGLMYHITLYLYVIGLYWRTRGSLR